MKTTWTITTDYTKRDKRDPMSEDSFEILDVEMSGDSVRLNHSEDARLAAVLEDIQRRNGKEV